MGPEKCSRSTFRWACEVIDKFGTMTIDKATLEALTEERLSKLSFNQHQVPGADALLQEREAATQDQSAVLSDDRDEAPRDSHAFLQEQESSNLGSPIFAAAIIGA